MTEDKPENAMSKYQLKKLVNELEDIRGRNTELVSLYIPAGYDMSKISDFVTSEQSEAENIKSKHTRTNVQDALGKIGRKVQEEHTTPENGVAFFAGNISDTEGRPDIQIWEVVPPEPIESRHYRCDKEFVLEPLKQMIVDDRVYGLIAVDKNNAAIGYLQGSSIKTLQTMSSEVPGKTRAGGQCLSPDSVVQMSSGELKEIQDVEVDDRVKSVDLESMELVDSRVTDRWESRKDLYRIETKHPRMTLEASGDHEVFVTDRGVEEKPVKDLSEGEKLLFPESVETSDTTPFLDSGKHYNSYRISDRGREEIRRERKGQNISQHELGRETGKTQTAVSKLEKGERDVKKKFLEDICRELDLDFQKFVRQKCTGKDLSLPERLDRELAQILGYFAGDGSFDPERLNFHEQDKEVAEEYRGLLEKKFDCNTSIRFREEKNYYNLRAFGKPLVKLFRNEFRELKKSGDTEIPKKILRSEDEILAGFIRGFYDAEGHCSSSRGRIGISANNQKIIRQLQSALLRQEVISSLTSYDNSENPYSDKIRYTLSISDQKSVENFAERIGFTAERKTAELREIVLDTNVRQKNRQVIKSGPEIRKTLEEHGKLMEDYQTANIYLQGKRNISKKAFHKNFINKAEGKLARELEKTLSKPDILPAEIKSIEKIEESRTIDISVEAGNFVANNLVVHNSAQRFARIRKEMLKNFLSDIAEEAKKSFLDKARDEKLLGILVGGPGWVKDKLVEDHLHEELKDKVVANKSLNYSGEEALEELVNKSEEAIRDAQVVREKNLMQDFFENLKEENGKSEYGVSHVKKALEMGAVETVLISEDANLFVAEYRCPNDHEEEVIEERPEIEDEIQCEECGEAMELESLSDIVDEFGKKAEEMGSDLEIISTEHEEGQRLQNMGGIAAILRYRIR